ncbi:MAG: chemotaxis protein CheW [Acidobacteriota bacterium]
MSKEFQSTSQLRLLHCAIGTHSYGIDLAYIQSIQRGELLQWNREKDGPIGWLATRQNRIPVFSLALQLKGELPLGKPTGLILVLNSKPRQWALMVEQLLGIVEVEKIHKLPAVANNSGLNFFKGVVISGERMLLYLDPDHLHPEAMANSYRQAQKIVSLPRRPKAANSNGNSDKAETKHNTGKGRIMLFDIDTSNAQSVLFGLSVTQVCEILSPLPLISVPGSPDYILGLVNWRDRPVPIIDLNARLGLERSSLLANDRFLIARSSTNNEWVGFAIQSNIKMQDLPIAYRSCTRNIALDHSLIRGLFELQDRLLVIPDIDTLCMPLNA